MPKGSLFTRPTAVALQENLGEPFSLFYDHGDGAESKNVGTIVVWSGARYVAPYRPKKLAHLDIAIVEKESHRARLLVEIEDTSSVPKTVIGDVLATLMGNGVCFKQNLQFQIGAWTTFVVCIYLDNPALKQEYSARLNWISSKLRSLMPHLDTLNAKIGELAILGFTNQQELHSQLSKYSDASS